MKWRLELGFLDLQSPMYRDLHNASQVVAIKINKIKKLTLHAYYVPGTVLNTLYIFI